MRGSRALSAWLFGLLLLFIGERVFGSGHGLRMPLDVVASLLLLGAFGDRLRLWLSSAGETKTVLSRLVIAYTLGLLGVAIYGAVAEGSPVGIDPDSDTAVLGMLAAVFLGLAGTLPALLMESSLASMYGARRLETRRVAEAGRAGLALALALTLVGFANYTANERDRKLDLRTFRDLTPSGQTLEMVRNLSEPVTVTLVFPPANDVAERITPYFEELEAASDQLILARLDRGMEPLRAKELRARKDGAVVISVGDKHESLSLGVDPNKVRSKLKKLDGDFQEELAKATRPQKFAYITTGHGERSTSPRADDPAGLKNFKQLLESFNYKVKKLGPKEGLSNQVPEDATLVVVAGPTGPMLESELQSLIDFVQGGGALLLLVDPVVDSDPELAPLLGALGLKSGEGVLAHDRKHLVMRRSIEDRALLATNRFSTHDSTTVLAKNSSRLAFFVDQAGFLEEAEASEGLDVQFTVRSMAGTWADLDGDYDYDTEVETKDVFQLAAAVQLPSETPDAVGGRALVTSDADVLGDLVLSQGKGNQQWIVDGLRWLEDDIALIGEVADIEDVPVLHEKEGEALWFWGTTFGVPLLVFGFGLGTSLRRRRTSR